MKRRFSFLITLASLILLVICLVLLLNLTNPSSAGPLGILVIFGVIYGIGFSLLLLLIGLLEVIYRAIRPPAETVVGQEKSSATEKRLTLVAAALSFVPIFLISLNSIGQLDFKDVALIIIIEALAIFYIVRRV